MNRSPRKNREPDDSDASIAYFTANEKNIEDRQRKWAKWITLPFCFAFALVLTAILGVASARATLSIRESTYVQNHGARVKVTILDEIPSNNGSTLKVRMESPPGEHLSIALAADESWGAVGSQIEILLDPHNNNYAEIPGRPRYTIASEAYIYVMFFIIVLGDGGLAFIVHRGVHKTAASKRM